jgi:serine/threonine-protein kinase
MAKDPNERYPDVGAMDRDLQRLQTGEVPEPEEPTMTGIATMIERTPPSGSQPRPATGQPSSAQPATAQRMASSQPAAPATPPPASGTTPMPSSAPMFREEDLHFVEVELARHIGPLARVLVKKAAKSAPNLVSLAGTLAENIPDEEGRRSFRAVVRARAS